MSSTTRRLRSLLHPFQPCVAQHGASPTSLSSSVSEIPANSALNPTLLAIVAVDVRLLIHSRINTKRARHGHRYRQQESTSPSSSSSKVMIDTLHAMNTDTLHKEAVHGDTDERRTLAAHMLGVRYHVGYDVNVDGDMARKWHIVAANAGNKDSRYLLGGCYRLGIGGEQNKQAAIQCFEAGAHDGDARAMARLAMLKLHGLPKPWRNMESTTKQQHDTEAMLNEEYDENAPFVGSKEELKEGRRWLFKAHALGNKEYEKTFEKLIREGVGQYQDNDDESIVAAGARTIRPKTKKPKRSWSGMKCVQQ